MDKCLKDKYDNFSMYLSEKQLREYADVFSDTFEQTVPLSIVQEAYDEIRHIEKEMIGRFGGPIEDLLFLYFMRYFSSIMDKSGDGIHLEIGTLFGGTAVVSHRASERSGIKRTNYLIDPLDGYYNQRLDAVAKIPVNEQTVFANLEKFGINHRQDIVLLKGYSQEDTIINEASTKRILSLYIDGDHSFTGVSNDWYNYSPMVVNGGYVLVDNYNDTTWPCVSFFVDNLIKTMPNNCWSVKLVFNRSILLQKKTDSRERQKEDAEFLTKEQIEKFEKHLEEKEKKFLIRIETRDKEFKALCKELEKAKIRIETRDKELEKAKIRIETRDKELEKAKIRIETIYKKLEKLKSRIDAMEKEFHNQSAELNAARKTIENLSERLNSIPSMLSRFFENNKWIVGCFRSTKDFFGGRSKK